MTPGILALFLPVQKSQANDAAFVAGFGGLTNVATSVKGLPCLQCRTVAFARAAKSPPDTASYEFRPR